MMKFNAEERLLKLNREDYKVLEQYMNVLGIRTRMTTVDGDTVVIQAENVYDNAWVQGEARERAEAAMTADAIKAYKR